MHLTVLALVIQWHHSLFSIKPWDPTIQCLYIVNLTIQVVFMGLVWFMRLLCLFTSLLHKALNPNATWLGILEEKQSNGFDLFAICPVKQERPRYSTLIGYSIWRRTLQYVEQWSICLGFRYLCSQQ